MITIVDYGVGNLFSLRSSFTSLGIPVEVSSDAQQISRAQRLILPGVGAFGDAAQKLQDSGLVDTIQDAARRGVPILGICLGMQLLFEKSLEFGEHVGLGLLPGEIRSLAQVLQQEGYALKIPHMGWNPLTFVRPDCPLLHYSRGGEYMYYVHSYYAANCQDSIVATSEYGIAVPGIVQKDNIFGTQFHPEKSGECGLRILRAFSEVPTC